MKNEEKPMRYSSIDVQPRFPNAKVQYAAWSDPETLKKDAEKKIRLAGAKYDDVLQFRKACRHFTLNSTSAQSLVDNTLKYWVTIEKIPGKRKNW